MVWFMCGLLLVLAAMVNSESKIEPRIYKGSPVKIDKYAYSVYIAVTVNNAGYNCGASILNHRIILTAAHCFDYASRSSTSMAFAGDENRETGQKREIKVTIRHGKYEKTYLKNDIALALLYTPFKLGRRVHRVALSKYYEGGHAEIAGWGVTGDNYEYETLLLHKTEQFMMSRNECVQILNTIPMGTFCGGKNNDKIYPSLGDSGSALLKDGFLQVGIVSHMQPDINSGITVYTDISYFYQWILINSKVLYCDHGLL